MSRISRWLARPTAGVVGVVLMFAAAGCGGSSGGGDTGGGDTAPATSAGGDVKRGGTLKASYSFETGCIDPAQAYLGQQLSFARSLADSLTFQDSDGKIQPWLATSWKTSPDLKQYTLTLRDDVTFSDGSKFTATTVKKNLDAMVKLGIQARLPSQYLAGMKSVTVVDPTTVRVTFENPTASFLQGLSVPAMGMVSDATTQLSPEKRCQGEFVGSGPFTLKSYTPNRQVQLVRRDGYKWPVPGSTNPGDAYLDGATFEMISDQSVRTNRLITGELQFLPELPSQDIKRVSASDCCEVAMDYVPGLAISVAFNPELLKDPKSPLSDLAFRQAIQAALDRAELVKPYGVEGYKASTSLLTQTTPFYSDQSALLAQDVEKANELLDEAGWTRSGNGIRTKDGKPAKVSMLFFASGGNLGPFLVMQQQLKDIGIDLEIDQVPPAVGAERDAAGDYELHARGGTRADPDTMQALRGTDAELDADLTAMTSTLDPAKRQEAVDAAVERALSQALFIPLYPLLYAAAYSNDVKGIQFEVSPAYWDLNAAWIDG